MSGRRLAQCLVCSTLLVCGARAFAWDVVLWDSSLPYDTVPLSKDVILQAAGTYKLYAVEGTELDSIGSVTVAPGVTGTVTLHIARPSGQTGVVNLGSINLDNAGTGKLAECRVQHDAAVSGDIIVDQLTGPFVIGHDVVHDVTAGTVMNTPVVTINGDCAGTLTIGGGIVQIFSLTLGSLSGSVNVPYVGAGGVTVDGDVSGSLQVRGNSGASEIVGNITNTGSVLFEGAVTNHLYIGDENGGNIDGTLEVRGDVTGTGGELRCFGSVNGTLTTGPSQGTSNMLFNIQIDKDVLGVIDIRETLHPQNGLGSLRILGALGSSSDPGFINVDGIQVQSPYSAYICINYNGLDCDEDVDDFWYAGSTITVGSMVYSGPSHAARVHGVPPTGGKGDCNGDHVCNFSDIDPFVGLLFDSTNMPGFNTAHLYMADTNNDGAVGFPDIDPFVALLGTTYCQEELMLMATSASASTSTGGGTDSQTVAGYLAANVSAANYDTLLDAVDYVATFPPVEPFTDWAQVAALLSGE